MPSQTLSDDLRSIATSDFWIEPKTKEEKFGLGYAYRRIIEAADRIDELEAFAQAIQFGLDQATKKEQ